MSIRNDDELDIALKLNDAVEADKFAQEMDDVLLDISELDIDLCPPDYRYIRGDREAWIYEHGNIAELVFVKTE